MQERGGRPPRAPRRRAAPAPAEGAPRREGGAPGAGAAAASSESGSKSSILVVASLLLHAITSSAAAAGLFQALRSAYEIRLYAIKDYGLVIHEFDPWFNFRAAQYLAERGWDAFFRWFDHMSWYPLGRPVATTIYPGMQITAVVIWHVLDFVGKPMSFNDVCVYIPAWFGVASTAFVALLAHECSGGSAAAAAAGAGVMAVLPAGALRAVGGLFDNECVAIPAMCGTFYLWCRSLRTPASWPIGAAAGLAYAYMAASWGGYIFALNVIGVHTAVLSLVGRYSDHLRRAYTLFFLVGTLGAMRVPVIGWSPLRSLEQLGPLAVFCALQLVVLAQVIARRYHAQSYVVLLAAFGAAAAVAIGILLPSGHFWPFSVRVRALFIKETRTGNPLVDSVAEHQPNSRDAYWTFLDKACYLAPPGLLAALAGPEGRPTDAGLFAVLLAGITYFFSLKMKRLMVLMGPPTATLAGLALGAALDYAASPLWRSLRAPSGLERRRRLLALHNSAWSRALRAALAARLAMEVPAQVREFYEKCHSTVRYSLSHPQIVLKSNDGGIIDDYREAYWWLRDNTPTDARIMAWWDYGYQIAGMANRTTLADGNTWSQEHIALLGLCLSSPVQEAHRLARHLADYILVWTGSKDDVGKSGHMARIANSVFKGHCAEQDCDGFGVRRNGHPSTSMRESLIWHLGRTDLEGSNQFQQVYRSRNKRVRIVRVLGTCEESRAWAASPGSKVCDAPGSWYCPGRYPSALRQLIGADPVAPDNAEAAEYRKEFEARIEALALQKPRENGPGIPPGSYLDSCRGCAMEDGGGTLRCTHCRLPGYPSEASALELGACSLREVDNIHGSLQCKPEPNAPDVPKGAYQKSCLGCKLESSGSVLRCTNCARADGSHAQSSYDLFRCPLPGSMDNQNGILTCVGLPHGPGVPGGGYAESCQGCRLEGDGFTLNCLHCRTSAGSQIPASYDVRRCAAPAVLDNKNGILTCVGVPNGQDIPAGPYRDSCQGCTLVGGHVLECTHCLAGDGKQVSSSVDLSTCPSASPKNSDGILTCGDASSSPALPPGKYTSSCRECQVRNGKVECAYCRTAAGGERPASYALARCPAPGRLDNRDGALACAGLPSGEGLPPGAYLDSCQGCHLVRAGALLECSHCIMSNGQQVIARHKTAHCRRPATLENHDGKLSCLKLLNAETIPPGKYQDSCQGCRLEKDGSLLSCHQCIAANGRPVQSSYELARCPAPGKLDSPLGVLRCVGLPNAPDIPNGGYTKSCQGCRLRPGPPAVVGCSHCLGADGRQRASSYGLERCAAPAALENRDGVLACAGVPSAAELPAGRYGASCQGCHLEAGHLACSHCRRADGQQVASSIDMQRCQPPASVDNEDGRLVCKDSP